MDAVIESKRQDNMSKMIRRSSQSLGRVVGGYLPTAVTEMWEPKMRDFAFIKLPAAPGTKSVVALNNTSQYALIVTSEGYFYQYAVDLEKGGECELIKQYSLLDNSDELAQSIYQ
jgi:autophagy-related protein 18